jgi:hypothetical protein
MRLVLAIAALIGSTVAGTAPETDALAKQGLDRLWIDVTSNPNSYSKSCTPRTAGSASRMVRLYEMTVYNMSHLLQVEFEAI